MTKWAVGKYSALVKRSYRQYCGLAVALDVVGERWALLVVRDLTPGPRRFNDLFAGLPGIATDVLTDRLRSLEAAGVVVQRELRHPVPANVYELTHYGRQLGAIAGDLARWGQRLMPAPDPDEFRISARWALQSMVSAYAGGLDDGEYELTIDGDQLTVRIEGDAASVAYGPATGAPVVTIDCSSKHFFGMAMKPPRGTRSIPGVAVTGDRAAVGAVFVALPLNVGRGS